MINLTAQADTVYTENYDIPMAYTIDELKLIRGGVVSVTEVRTGMSGGGSGSVLAATSYYLDADNAMIKRTDYCYFDIGRQEVQVQYTAGFSTVPEDLQAAANLAVIYFMEGAPKTGLKSEKIGRYSYTRSENADDLVAGLPPHVAAMVNQFVPGGGIVPRTQEQ